MAENKLRLAPGNVYSIEVNDAGERIEFDLADAGLPHRFMRAIERFNDLERDYTKKADAINRRPDMPRITFGDDGVITQNQYDAAELVAKLYDDARVAFDGFLGDGACQKIFGNRNWYTMFDDLLEQLEPHLKKMGLNAANIRKKIAEKHAPNRSARRTLK